VVLIGIVALDVEDDQGKTTIAAEDDAAGGSAAGQSFEHFEVGTEEVVEEGAFACVLTADDGDGEVLLAAVPEGCEYGGQGFPTGYTNPYLKFLC
jgi:hypothetical protein